MSKDRWAATAAPGIRRATLRALTAEAGRLDQLASRADRLGDPSRGLPFAGGAHQLRQLDASLEAAELLWTSGEMAQVGMDASHDVPEMDIGDCPFPHGLLLFSTPLPGIAVPAPLTLRGDRAMIDYHEPVPLDAILWTRGVREGIDHIAVELLVRTSRLPAPLYGVDTPLSPFQQILTTLPVVFEGMRMASRDSSGQMTAPRDAAPQMVAVLAFLSACWVLMMTPTVAQRTPLDGRWGGPATGRTRPRDLVTAVDLRPLRYVRSDHDTSGRKLTNRHIVRGHWTHQHHGHQMAQVRLQWIAPFIRGPEGAPLIQTEKVMVWRR